MPFTRPVKLYWWMPYAIVGVRLMFAHQISYLLLNAAENFAVRNDSYE
ncbi:hypothetical protein [Ruminococcus sp. YE71]|nr:hypothetical protein [Ruminococcus sp. YE71]